MHDTVNATQARIAAVTALVVTAASLTAAIALGRWAAQLDVVSSNDVLGVALAFAAAAFLLRLCWICGGAALDLFGQSRRAASFAPEPRPQSQPQEGSRSRQRAASLFLAFAAVLVGGSNVATASPATVSVVSSQATDVRSVGVQAATGALPAAPVPGFTAPHASSEAKTANYGTTTPVPSFGENQALLASDGSTPCADTAPVPGFTPKQNPPAASECRLVTSGSPVSHTAATGPSTHVVLRGQTLWSIAASYLPADATAAQVAESVEEWVSANPALAGDPDLLRPGDALDAPGRSGHEGAAR